VPKPVIVCLKWGTRYPCGYVNRLARAVAGHLTMPHRFVCLTDETDGLAEGVEALPIPPFPLDRSLWGRGIWPKLTLFTPGLFPDGTKVLFLDLDLMVTGDLSPFLGAIRPGTLHIIREWNPALLKLLPVPWRPDRGGNSSVVGFVAGEQAHVLEKFCEDPDAARSAFRNDQEFITAHAAGRQYWPDDWCASFKRHCVWYFPWNMILRHPKRPDWARVIVFHGKPDPTDLIGDDSRLRWGGPRKFGYGPVTWVREYWDRYGDT
jgi:hypothetical protein